MAEIGHIIFSHKVTGEENEMGRVVDTLNKLSEQGYNLLSVVPNGSTHAPILHHYLSRTLEG